MSTTTNWRAALNRLAPLALPLLPCGAGAEKKAPLDHTTGRPLSGWETAAFTVEQLLAMNGVVRSVGTRTGRDAQGLIAFDIDGETALELALRQGCDPQQARTWQIHRDTDPCRLKVCWRLTEEQSQQLGNVSPKALTRRPGSGEKGQALEVFHHPGRQIVVIGEHPSSGGNYLWPDGHGPEVLAPIPPEWWTLALAIAAGELGIAPAPSSAAKASRTTSRDWQPAYPCPICRRNTTDFCSRNRSSGTIRCFHGNTFSPELQHGQLKVGQTITGTDGITYGFCGSKAQANGAWFSTFVVHKPREQRPSDPALADGSTDEPERLPGTFQALIQALRDGWSKKGTHTLLTPGLLAQMLPAHLLRFNEMDLRAEVLTTTGWQRITDAAMTSAYVVLTGKGWKIGKEPVCDAVLHAARQTPFHPIRHYLQRLEADPTITPVDLDQVAKRFFRSPGQLYSQMVRKWLIGAVARALEPGCKMDYCLVLKGGQGLLKSTTLQALASPDWFCSSTPEGEKDFLQAIHSCWIYELAELEHITGRRAAGHLKALFATPTDTFRPPYGRTPERHPRQSVFCATVNKDEFLRDDTGNRRYWVIPIEGTDPLPRSELAAARDAIWKAAVLAYRQGELPMLSAELETLSNTQNEQFNEQDPWVEMVRAWIGGRPVVRWDPERDPSTLRYAPDTPFTTVDVLYSAGLRRPDSITRADEMRAATALRQLGFQRDKNPRTVDGARIRCWCRPAQPAQPAQPLTHEVVHPQIDCAGTDLATPAQPAQPQTTNRGIIDSGGSGPSAQDKPQKTKKGCAVVQFAEIDCAGTDLSCTTSEREVVQQQEVVQLSPPGTGDGPLEPPADLKEQLGRLIAADRAAGRQPKGAVLVNLLASDRHPNLTGRLVDCWIQWWDARPDEEVA
ncbi:MAG: hypothetical protein RLZZ106_1998 [Cyanobacteriota bacterium]|jgi:predicted P-loop ATPase